MAPTPQSPTAGGLTTIDPRPGRLNGDGPGARPARLRPSGMMLGWSHLPAGSDLPDRVRDRRRLGPRDTAAVTCVPRLVQPTDLDQANGRLIAGQKVGHELAGPPAGGCSSAWPPSCRSR